MSLRNDLKALKEFQCEQGKCVLSVYLNTDRSEQDQQKGEWKIRLKNGLKRLEEYLVLSGEEDQLKSYKRLRRKVEKEIRGNQSHLQKSVVIFASEEGLWSSHYLQLPVDTSFHWEKAPVLDQLEEFQKAFPRTGIIMPNLDQIKIYDAELGEIKDTRVYEFDIETDDWKVKKGAASTDRIASSANHVDDYQQRFENNLNRFYKKMANQIEQMKRDRKWESVYIIGEPDLVRTLEAQVRIDVDQCVMKNLSNSQSSKVLAQVFQ
ncbi:MULTISPECIES: VLRF1 family aeRF1-type release factor [Bacillaceae]|uniref:Protein required for attachment to host cells n=1 Tax=Evansella alkalicola TaxID=745819 RepID=A0ABS6JWF3_9BACI|nr:MULTISPECIES: VLRF1 family aeRF1-type release factor [Bacillaceae]MBU9722901.1 hypothetical protein [Bacillus alkalicola]